MAELAGSAASADIPLHLDGKPDASCTVEEVKGLAAGMGRMVFALFAPGFVVLSVASWFFQNESFGTSRLATLGKWIAVCGLIAVSLAGVVGSCKTWKRVTRSPLGAVRTSLAVMIVAEAVVIATLFALFAISYIAYYQRALNPKSETMAGFVTFVMVSLNVMLAAIVLMQFGFWRFYSRISELFQFSQRTFAKTVGIVFVVSLLIACSGWGLLGLAYFRTLSSGSKGGSAFGFPAVILTLVGGGGVLVSFIMNWVLGISVTSKVRQLVSGHLGPNQEPFGLGAGQRWDSGFPQQRLAGMAPAVPAGPPAILEIRRAKAPWMQSASNAVIFLDGVMAGRPANGQTITLETVPGKHVIESRWLTTPSQALEFEVTSGERVVFSFALRGSKVHFACIVPPQQAPVQKVVSMIPPPHRGGTILFMAFLSFLVGGWPAIFAIAYAVSDLKKMDKGQIDRSGRGLTAVGMVIAVLGLTANIVGLILMSMNMRR